MTPEPSAVTVIAPLYYVEVPVVPILLGLAMVVGIVLVVRRVSRR